MPRWSPRTRTPGRRRGRSSSTSARSPEAGGLDFDDLVVRSMRLLESDAAVLAELAGAMRPPPRRRSTGPRPESAPDGAPARGAGEPDLPRRGRRPVDLRLAPRRRAATAGARRDVPAGSSAGGPGHELPMPGVRRGPGGPAGRAERGTLRETDRATPGGAGPRDPGADRRRGCRALPGGAPLVAARGRRRTGFQPRDPRAHERRAPAGGRRRPHRGRAVPSGRFGAPGRIDARGRAARAGREPSRRRAPPRPDRRDPHGDRAGTSAEPPRRSSPGLRPSRTSGR